MSYVRDWNACHSLDILGEHTLSHSFIVTISIFLLSSSVRCFFVIVWLNDRYGTMAVRVLGVREWRASSIFSRPFAPVSRCIIMFLPSLPHFLFHAIFTVILSTGIPSLVIRLIKYASLVIHCEHLSIRRDYRIIFDYSFAVWFHSVIIIISRLSNLGPSSKRNFTRLFYSRVNFYSFF